MVVEVKIMLFNEFGKKENPAILLMHGMLQDWHSLWEILKPLEEKYRVIVPAMDGMYDNSPDFTTFADQCRQIEAFVNENYGGKLRGVYGLSQGAAVMSELLARGNIKIDVAVFDGAYVVHQGKLAAYAVLKTFWSMLHNIGKPSKTAILIRKYMQKRMGRKPNKGFSLSIIYKNVSYESMKRNLYENYTYRVNPNLKDTDTKVYLWCGSKEPFAVKSQKVLKKYLKNYEEEIFEGLAHGELLLSGDNAVYKKLCEIF
jgi:pimeloyl-ACP methyl ester carboxylesterase